MVETATATGVGTVTVTSVPAIAATATSRELATAQETAMGTRMGASFTKVLP
jgi:hypothetical protein